MKKLLTLLLLLAPSVLAQNPTSGGPIPQTTYQTLPNNLGVPNGTTVSGSNITFPGAGTFAKLSNQVWFFASGYNGAVCDGVTNDTTAFNNLLTTVYAANGGIIDVVGTCLLSGAVVFPNNNDVNNPTQASIRITGGGNSAGGYLVGTLGPSPSTLDMTNNATVAKFDTRGTGVLEIDHITLKDSAADCANFIHTTNTILSIHDTSFIGTAVGAAACNDAIVLGGTVAHVGNASTDAFQGYGTDIRDNFFSKIQRGVYARTYANGVVIKANTWDSQCGAGVGAGAIELDNGIQGDIIRDNIFELAHYVYGVKVTNATKTLIDGNGFYDTTATTVADVDYEAASTGNLYLEGLSSVTGAVVKVRDLNGLNAICSATNNTFTCGSPASGALGLEGLAIGAGTGVKGVTDTGYGVYGLTASTNSNAGVVGQNTNTGWGVSGIAGTGSIGTGGTTDSGYGVYGTATSTGTGGYFLSSSGEGIRAISTSGATIASFYAGAVLKAYINSTGLAGFANLNVSGLTASSPICTDGSLNLSSTCNGSIMQAYCIGVVTNLVTAVLAPLQPVSTSCNSATSFTGPAFPAATFKNMRVKAATASNTPGSGVVTFYKNGVATALTCTLGITASCSDTVNSFTTVADNVVTAKVASAGGTLTVGPTYVSGSSACTNGSQIVTFTNNTSGVNPVNATGTITVAANVPTGAVTITTGGAGYTAATPPTTGTVATCTGTGTFTGGTVTVDTLSGIEVIYSVY